MQSLNSVPENVRKNGVMKNKENNSLIFYSTFDFKINFI